MPTGVYKRTEENQARRKEIHNGPSFKRKMSELQMGKNNSAYKTGKYLYRSIHNWVVKHYGQPTTCEHCQTNNLVGHKIHWATKSLPYTRNRENWVRLCAKCHGIYDKINKLRKGVKLLA